MGRDSVLIVDDEKLIRWSLRSALEAQGYRVDEAGSGEEAFAKLDGEGWDLLILDHRLPDITGLEILERVHHDSPEIAVLMMTAYGTVEDAVRAMKNGAFDYLTKPVNMDELMLVVGKALETTRLRREVSRLRQEQRDVDGAVQLIGKSPAMASVVSMVDKVAASQAATILLQGESGTGKNIVAKAIHYGSPRSDRPFVNITCSALTETLLESELFGHERGAFTDAKSQKKGLLEIADGGTVFLDEIGEMGMAMQAKLLRFIEEKTFRRVGGTRDIRVEVRIIAATNRVLSEVVADGRFREDLFYRLQVIPITIPPLRERREDLPLLVQEFLDHFNGELRKSTDGVEPGAMERLLAHDWPGNVRELRNLIERILILESKRWITAEDLPPTLGRPTVSTEGEGGLDFEPGSMTLEQLERAAIGRALEHAGFNQVRAARILGISRDTLRYRMKKFGFAQRSHREPC